MRRWAVILAATVLLLTVIAVGAEHSALRITNESAASPDARFDEFFKEYRGMVMSWWEHGGFRTTEDKWQVVAQEVVRPGQKLPHFVVSVWREGRGKLELQFVLSFSIPPFAQTNLFLVSHAAYSATLGAIMGESRFQGRLEWKGLDIGETM